MKRCFELSNSLSLRVRTREQQPSKKPEPTGQKPTLKHVTFHLSLVITQMLGSYVSRQMRLPVNNQVKIVKVQNHKHPPHWEPKEPFVRSMDLIILKISKIILDFCHGQLLC